MEITDVKAKIYFLLREKLYATMLSTCTDALRKFAGESTLNLYHAIALYLNKRFSECTRELEALKTENDLQLAAIIALVYIKKSLSEDNSENLSVLDTSLKESKRNAGPMGFCNAAFVLYSFGKHEKALEYVTKGLKLGSEILEIHALKGWILLDLAYQELCRPDDCVAVFDKCLQDSKRQLDFSLGLCEAYVLIKDFVEAQNIINKTIVRFPALSIPLVSKARVLFSLQDFDAALECCNRVLGSEETNLIALKIKGLIFICRDGNYEEAAKIVANIGQLLQQQEPKNATILLDFAALFSRICNKNDKILSETLKFLERAVYLESNNIDCVIELGYQCYLQKKYKEGLKYFKTASKTDSNSFKTLLGLTLCEFADKGPVSQIKQQILFLQELNSEPNNLLLFMQAKIASNSEATIRNLEECFGEQLKPIMNLPFGEVYLKLLDPDFLLEVVKYYMQFAPKSAGVLSKSKTTDKPNNIVVNSLNTLKIIAKACPGLEEAQFLLAKVHYLKGELVEASAILNRLIEIDDTRSEVHLLMAQIHMENNLYERASQSLEIGLSHNFQVRENPLYHLLYGLIEKSQGKIDDCIKSFNSALGLLENSNDFDFTLSDKASIYIELINAYGDSNQVHEASKLMEDAIELFQNTPEEARIMILSAENLAELDNVEKAINMLSRVNPNESYYLEARSKLAEIFLNRRHDKKAFLECYQEMLQFNMTPESYLLLGDAYMKILEPDKALEAYNNALQLNPEDPTLMFKMGRALIDTHYYKKAIIYFKESIQFTGNPEMTLQLAELYMNLKEYEEAEKLLNSEISNSFSALNSDDLIALKYKSKIYKLLAEVLEKGGKINSAITTLRAGRDNQNRIRKILSVEQAVVPQAELDDLVQFNYKLAELSFNLRENEKAVNYYKDALDVSPNNLQILGALAKLYMQLNYLDLCQQTCGKLLNVDSDNEIASVLMADISFRKIDFDMAVFHFTQLVNKQPTNWTALMRLIEVLRRTGNLEEIPQYLKQAEQFSESNRDSGLNYCIALYQWYTGNLNAALRNFNQARQDADLGPQAIINMIEICLNPEDEIMGDQFNVDFDDYEYRDSRSMAIRTAERLLKELKQISFGQSEIKCRLLGNFILLSSKEKHSIERALEDFIAMASQDNYKDQIGPILGVATAYTLLKQGQRAKTQLKRLIKNVWTFEDAEYLERCWLLLADYYVQSGKYDLAYDLVKKVLQYNMASCKAYEYAGYICEKEQRYKEAANQYECAWKYNGRNNPSIGYRLAYNLMKCKRFADAIDIAQIILRSNPEYVRIKKDILDKSINNLRT